MIKILFWYIQKLKRISISLFYTLIISSILLASITTIELIIFKKIIEYIENHMIHRNEILISKSIVMLFGVLLIVMIISSFLAAINKISNSLLWEKEGLRGEVIRKASKIKLSLFESSELYNLMQRVSNGIGFRTKSTTNALLNVVFTFSALCSMGILLTSTIFWIPVIMIIFAIPQWILLIKQSEQNYDLEKTITQNQRILDYNFRLLTERESIKEIKIYSLAKYILDKWLNIFNMIKEDKVKLIIYQSKKNIVNQAYGFVSIFLSLIIIVYSAYSGFISLGGLIVLIQGVFLFQKNLEDIGKDLSELSKQLFFAIDLRDFLDYEEDLEPGKIITDETIAIEFKNVYFKYPNSNYYVLKDINLVINPKKTLALVGINGSGKSTIIKLILGIYHPTSGAIYINGTNIKELNLREWREKIGVVYQDFAKFQFKVRDNIGFGDIERIDNIDQIYEASKNANLHESIENLEKKYETRLGKYFEDGVDLSGGQWQKLSIARAFFKEFKFLIFDEPASALDAKAELELFKTFHKLSRNKGAIFVSHRLLTTRFADQIVLLIDGEIIEQGDFKEMIESGGEYSKMFKLQGELYGEESEAG